MTLTRFKNLLTTETELRAMLGEPSELSSRKGLTALDQHCQAFITRSPFLLLGTFSNTGACDVSPRGDAPGFVQMLDEKTLVIPDRPGNRRFDSLRNILQTARVGLLFIVPGVGETLRVNGQACILRDPEILATLVAHDKLPRLAIGVEVEECFMQCAKALKRSQLWNPATWPAREELPSMAQMMLDHARPTDRSLEEIEVHIEESYTNNIY